LGERAEEHRADDAAGALGRGGEIAAEEALRRIAAGLEQHRRIGAPIAHGDLFRHREDAMGRGDERGAIGRDEAPLHGAPSLHQLRPEDDVDVAGHRHQGHHRFGRPFRQRALREELDVIDRGAGALRHARHRGELREIAAMLGEIDDPVGEHAAALPAHREDGDADGAGLDRALGLR
jgi:hypothetical protein